jgi:hypothetical protein
MPRYEVLQEVECWSSSTSTYRWTVKITMTDCGVETTTAEGSGLAESDPWARKHAESFTRWAVRTYNLFGLNTNADEDE